MIDLGPSSAHACAALLSALATGVLAVGMAGRSKVAAAGEQGARFPIREERTTVPLGETSVEIVAHETDRPGLTYASVHDDENTAVAATLGTLRRRGGRLVELRHTGERDITFSVEGKEFTFDPNRIFTDAGAEATLRDLGSFSDEALAVSRAFARRFLEIVDLEKARKEAGLIVTVHNNEVGHYSAKSYRAGGDYEREAKVVRHTTETAPDDFFFVTERDHYALLQGGDFHVVLQDNTAMTDDGSLSVYAAERGLPYVNVEAQHGHLREQIDMLDFLNERLEER